MVGFESRRVRGGQGGFTLIEVMVVIAILAVLVSVIVFAIGNSADNAEHAACVTERTALIESSLAADASNSVDYNSPQETYLDYLDVSAGPLDYFVQSGSGFARVNLTAVDDVTQCLAIT